MKFVIIGNKVFVQIWKQNMIVVVNKGLRYYQQAMIAAGIAIDDGGAGITSCPVCPELLPIQGIIQIDELRFVKLYVAHVDFFSELFKFYMKQK